MSVLSDALHERMARVVRSSSRDEDAHIRDAVTEYLDRIESGGGDDDATDPIDQMIQRLLDDGAVGAGISVDRRRLYRCWVELDGELIQTSSSELRRAVKMLRARAEHRMRGAR